LNINITGFTGIELLQITKAIALFGATYDDILTVKTSVMVCNDQKLNPDKLRFTTDNRIPAVRATWFWESIRLGKAQPYQKHIFNPAKPQPQKQNADGSFTEVPTAPLSEEDSVKLKQKRAQAASTVQKPRGALRRPGTLELSHSAPPTPASSEGSSLNPNTADDSTNAGQDAQLPDMFDGAASLPLQDINPSVNSPRRPSTSSNSSTSRPSAKAHVAGLDAADVATKPAPANRRSRLTEEVTSDAPDSAASFDPGVGGTSRALETSKPPEIDYSSIMSKLLANRKTATPADKDTEVGRRKRRPLGRAQSGRSNHSTTEENMLSRQSSLSKPDEVAAADAEAAVEEEEEAARRPFQMPLPSQELGWDSPGAQKARERMIRAMGGKLDEGSTVLEEVGVVKEKVSDNGGGIGGGRASRKRRG
jgi:DNA replication regulator DPB11